MAPMNCSSLCEGPVILIGYPWRLQIEAASPLFEADVRYFGYLRRKRNDPEVLTYLSTEGGGIRWISKTVLELNLAVEQTAPL